MARLHNVNKKAYQVSKKKMKKTVHMEDIYGTGIQQKTPNLEAEQKVISIDPKLTTAKIKSKQLIEVEYMMSRLIAKHKDNIKAMEFDRLNVLQFTENKLQREYNRYMKISDNVDVNLSEKMLQNVLVDEEVPKQPVQFETMNVQYASRVAQLQKMMK